MLLEFLVILALVVCARAYVVIKRPKENAGRENPSAKTRTVGVFLGSGGHTAEALALISTLDPSRYPVRKYLVSSGDTLSCEKALAFEAATKIPEQGSPSRRHAIVVLPRARKVHQSLLTTPPTFLYSLLVALWHITLAPALQGSAFSDVLLLNGPGTCVVVAACVWIGRFLGLKTPRVIYVESFARVKRLSLSGKILKFCADRFIVQWPELLSASGKRAEYRGWLV